MKRTPLLLLLALASPALGAFVHTCESLTGIVGCVECRKNVCLYCDRRRAMQWKAGPAIQSCSVATKTTGCSTNCAICTSASPSTCILCKSPAAQYLWWGSEADARFGTCQPGTKALVSGNSKCTDFNSDSTCGACSSGFYALPNNAQFTNGIYPTSQCKSRAELNAIASAAFGASYANDVWTPSMPITGCSEVGTDLMCQRCVAGFSLLPPLPGQNRFRCVRNDARPGVKNANGCSKTLAYQQYCLRCNAVGDACLACVPGRGMKKKLLGGKVVDDGVCSIPCKQLFGLTCGSCTQGLGKAYPECLTNDPQFANGRR